MLGQLQRIDIGGDVIEAANQAPRVLQGVEGGLAKVSSDAQPFLVAHVHQNAIFVLLDDDGQRGIATRRPALRRADVNDDFIGIARTVDAQIAPIELALHGYRQVVGRNIAVIDFLSHSRVVAPRYETDIIIMHLRKPYN